MTKVPAYCEECGRQLKSFTIPDEITETSTIWLECPWRRGLLGFIKYLILHDQYNWHTLKVQSYNVKRPKHYDQYTGRKLESA